MPSEDENNEKIVSGHPVAPGEGERRAISGYYSQYLVSASLIYRALRGQKLNWIRLADPEAGRVDDLQIGGQSRVDAFQVKWSQYGGNFSFHDLKASGSGPSIIAQLADGWSRLKRLHPGQRIAVHLINNQIPSVSDRPPVGDPPPTPRHFAAFLGQAWNPARKEPEDSQWDIPAAWSPTWDELRAATGLSPIEFKSFIHDCELEFGYRIPELGVNEREGQIIQADLQQITQSLFAAVADPVRIIELNLDQLLLRLGWKERFEFKSRHEFPVNEALYHPIEENKNQLEAALSNLPGGYIAVIGTPGSGKSTFLTETLRSRPERVIRYYAYVPEAQDPIILRGESINFLHDVVLALERTGFRVGESLVRLDRDQLLGRFHHQLQLLHEDWQTSGRKTLILIDGLDHIAREQNPNRSLLEDLPLPEQVPDGVYFILGSQTDAPFPDRVQAVARRPDRRIEMRPLSREAVFEVIGKAELSVNLSHEQKEKLYVLSGGHPLSLGYLLNHLQDVTDIPAARHVLDSTERYEGSIEQQYHSYWREIQRDEELAHLLGLLGRLRRVIDLSWVETWSPRSIVDRLRQAVPHYFRREDHNRWYFFHNSFRLFLLDITSESSPGLSDPSKNKVFHHELAEICAKTPPSYRAAWEELYHRSMAEEHVAILQRGTQEWFRNQFLSFRPAEAILTDIRFALRSVAACQDPTALTRLALSTKEINDRASNLDESSHISLLLNLGERDIVIEYIRDGNRLRIHPREALQISIDLKLAGHNQEAHRVFELAEPVELFSAPIEDDTQNEKGETLESWARAAVHFRKLEKVIETIRRARRGPDRFQELNLERGTQILQNGMLFAAGRELIHMQQWENLARILHEFDQTREEDTEARFWLQVHAWRDRMIVGDREKAQSILNQVLTSINVSSVDSEERVAIAEAIYRTLGDAEKARTWLTDVQQPDLRTDILHPDGGLNPFLQRFRLNRLLYALGENRSPVDIIPDSREPRHQGMVYFERAICIVARIWGNGWRGRQSDGPTISREVYPILRLFNRRFEETRDWTSWYIAQNIRPEFYTLLVDAVAHHEAGAIQALVIAFETEWDHIENKIYWPPNVRRQIILALSRVGVSREWVVRRLGELENIMLDGKDVSGRIDECRKQAEAWVILGEKSSARELLAKMFNVSQAVGYRKDYQLNKWIHWLGRINEVEPEKAAERISWFARAIVSLEESTEGAASRYSANELLSATFRWSPRRAIKLLYWFMEHGIIWFEEAVRVIMKAAIETSNPPVRLILFCLADFMLAISTEADPTLGGLLVEKTARLSIEKGINAVRYLLSKVNTYGLPEARKGWRYGLAEALVKLKVDLQQVGLEQEDLLPDRESGQTNRLLQLRDGTKLNFIELEARGKTVSELQTLLQNEAEGSYFGWESFLPNIIEKFTRDDLISLADLFMGTHRSSQILSIISERISVLGDRNAAWEIGLKALDASYSWSPWIDGGTRQVAFRALVKIDPVRARPLLYETLVRDGGGGAENMEEIVLLLTDSVPVRDIWAEMEKYVQGLFVDSNLTADSPDFPSTSFPHDTAEWAFADLILANLNHPANAIANAAQKACGKCLIENNPTILDYLKESFEGSEDLLEHILLVLDAISFRNSNVILRFREELARLRSSPNYAIRKISGVLCQRIGCEPVAGMFAQIPLPPIYRLSIPKHSAGTVLDEKEITGEEPLPDSNDPARIVSPLNLQLGFISEEAQLPKVNVFYRAVEVMQQLAPQESWSAQGERKLRSILSSAGLKLPFRRPRVILVRRATHYIIAELADAGILGPENLDRLESSFRFYDPVMILVEPQIRPKEIGFIAEEQDHRLGNEEWLGQIDKVIDMGVTCLSEGYFVLAEETNLKRLEWETPMEIRRSTVYQSSRSFTTVGLESESVLETVINSLITEYPDMGITEAPVPFILRHKAYGYDSPGGSWLALNPTIAHQFRWTLAKDGLFKWLNDQGEVMAESIWWMDGLINQSPPHLYSEVGDGWLVVASQVAWEAIRSRFGNLKRMISVERSFYRDQQRIKSSRHLEMAL